jgi:hypothetical protein
LLGWNDAAALQGPNAAPSIEGLANDVERLRKALQTIADASAQGTEQFRERLGDRKSPTWWAVNVLQDHLACCGGHARLALEATVYSKQAPLSGPLAS